MQQTFREKIAPALGRNLRDYYAAVLKEPLPQNLRSGLTRLNQPPLTLPRPRYAAGMASDVRLVASEAGALA